MLIFVSYARDDEELVRELLAHLRPLEAERRVRLWLDTSVEGGAEWEAIIRAKLAEAALVVACVTPRFNQSSWCRQETAFARQAKTPILPVHISKFSKRNDLFGDLQYVPSLARAVVEWGDQRWHRDDPWSQVTDAVHERLDRIELEAAKAKAAAGADERATAAEEKRRADAAEATRQAQERAAKETAARAEADRRAKQAEAERRAQAAAAKANAERRARASSASPMGPWPGDNAHLVPPMITIVPGTHTDGEPGTFWMGSPEGVGDAGERPRRLVTLTRPYAIGETPVTQAQWRAVVQAAQAAPWANELPGLAALAPSPSAFQTGPEAPQRPVEQVSWHDALLWCAALSRLTGRTPAWRRVGHRWEPAPPGTGFRLPTEAEWEHAARAGTQTRWSFGDDERALADHGWFDGNASDTTHPVKARRPNPWGLYDVHGNVWEWCADGWSNPYDPAATVDPFVPPHNDRRVVRGGSRWNSADWCRSAYRLRRRPDDRFGNRGLRVALSPPPSAARP